MHGTNMPLGEVAGFGLALVAQALAGSAVQGATISNPAKVGRFLTFILQGAAVDAGVTDAVIGIEGRRIIDGVTEQDWQDVKAKDGVTDLVFTAASFANTAAIENGVVIGTIDVSKYNYTDFRLDFRSRGGSGNLNMGASYVITGLHKVPIIADGSFRKADDLYYKAHFPDHAS